MKKIIILMILSFALMYAVGYAQRGSRQGAGMGGKITGTIVDGTTEKPVPYASVGLYIRKDSTVAGGDITDKNGKFEIENVKPGKYYICIKFIGYASKYVSPVDIKFGSKVKDLGKIKLEVGEVMLDGVKIEADKAPVEYKIDKKVIDAKQFISAQSGSAVDILENVPSVDVDIEGNVSLRGSGNFMVLIDGRPSVLDANDALQQIPATMIENIEIMTNPSAKYDPDGTAGIINIVTNKKKLSGISGYLKSNIGMYGSYGLDFLGNYKNNGMNFFIGADYNKRSNPGSSESENWTLDSLNNKYSTWADGDRDHNRENYSARIGMDYDLTDNDMIMLQGRYGYRGHNGESDVEYIEQFNDSDPSTYNTTDESERGGYFYSADFDYTHKFNKLGHELALHTSYSYRDTEEENVNEQLDGSGNKVFGTNASEDGPLYRGDIKIDYALPVGDKGKFESGYQLRYRNYDDITSMEFYNPDTQVYELQPLYSHSVNYDRQIHSIFSQYADESGNFGYQLGLRGEYTWRKIVMEGEDYDFKIDRFDFFPSVHSSYKFDKDHQMIASYSRRIHRPRGWEFEPFYTWQDAYNVRRGNPEIQPEFINSYELGFQKYMGKNMFSAEVYYRDVRNKMERVRSVYEADVWLNTSDNVGTAKSLGVELMLNLNLFDFWRLNLMGNIYDYRMEGELNGKVFDKQSNNWSSRFNNTFIFGKSTRLQFNGSYYSGSTTAQGSSEGFFMTSAALRQEFFDGNLSATLQARDLFGTGKHEFTSQDDNFYSYLYFDRTSPMLSFTLSYNFNNYKEKKRSEGGDDDFEGGSEF